MVTSLCHGLSWSRPCHGPSWSRPPVTVRLGHVSLSRSVLDTSLGHGPSWSRPSRWTAVHGVKASCRTPPRPHRSTPNCTCRMPRAASLARTAPHSWEPQRPVSETAPALHLRCLAPQQPAPAAYPTLPLRAGACSTTSPPSATPQCRYPRPPPLPLLPTLPRRSSASFRRPLPPLPVAAAASRAPTALSPRSWPPSVSGPAHCMCSVSGPGSRSRTGRYLGPRPRRRDGGCREARDLPGRRAAPISPAARDP